MRYNELKVYLKFEFSNVNFIDIFVVRMTENP
jgi:hypothetical protein